MIDRTAKHELRVIGCALFLFLGLATYSISYARAAVRDDLRKQDVTNMKRALEQYYNVHGSYVTPPREASRCTSTNPDSWFFGNSSPLLQAQFIDAIPHDVRESKGFVYSYCTSGATENGAQAFYLEATMESNVREGVFFDEDEQRKFGYRVLLEDGEKLYRVCGGDEQQCKIESL